MKKSTTTKSRSDKEERKRPGGLSAGASSLRPKAQPLRSTVQRNTRQREALLTALQGADHPLSPQEIERALKKTIPSISISTVYRNLKVLIEEGVIVAVPVVGLPDRYEVAGKAHHHHFHCDRCDRVFDLAGCLKGLTDLLPAGFRLNHHHLQLNGLCVNCSKR